jgi:hypothetical protein
LTTIFLLAAAIVASLAQAQIAPIAAPVCYAATLAVALCTGILGVLKSPFVK